MTQPVVGRPAVAFSPYDYAMHEDPYPVYARLRDRRTLARHPDPQRQQETKAADLGEATWPNLTGKFRPHDDRHSHATWLDAANLHKVIQMDRRGHAMPGMDAVYNHVTNEMRQQLCDALQTLWHDAVAQRLDLTEHSAVSILNETLAAF